MRSFEFVVADEDSGVNYRPWTDGHAVGFEVWHPDGTQEFLYLNPSGGSDDRVPSVFVYRGADGDPSVDAPQHHYDLAFDGEGEARFRWNDHHAASGTWCRWSTVPVSETLHQRDDRRCPFECPDSTTEEIPAA